MDEDIKKAVELLTAILQFVTAILVLLNLFHRK